jgi:hypothetical protein
MTPAALRKAGRDKTAPEMIAAARSYAELLTAGTISEQPNPANRRQRIAADSRTTTGADGVPCVVPFYVSASGVFIVCPYCGEIHTHGNSADGYTGHRTAHCMSADSAAGYIIRAV